jgi:hypothetical protein
MVDGFMKSHARIEDLYHCDCPHCQSLLNQEENNPKPNFNHKAFEEAMKAIHEAEKVSPESLKLEGVKHLIYETDKALSNAVKFGIADNVIPEAMSQSLE